MIEINQGRLPLDLPQELRALVRGLLWVRESLGIAESIVEDWKKQTTIQKKVDKRL